MRYETSEETLEVRIRKGLIENIQWYKADNRKRDTDEDHDEHECGVDYERWKPWKKKKRRKCTKRRVKLFGGTVPPNKT